MYIFFLLLLFFLLKKPVLVDSSLVGLDFKGPVNTVDVMSSWSVYLTTVFLRAFLFLSG